MKHNDQVNAGPPLVGNHGLAPPAASSGDGRAVESSSPTRSWANVMGSPGRGEGPPGGGRGILDLLPNPGSTWGARACRRGRATPPTGPGLRWWPPQPGGRVAWWPRAPPGPGSRSPITSHHCCVHHHYFVIITWSSSQNGQSWGKLKGHSGVWSRLASAHIGNPYRERRSHFAVYFTTGFSS